MNVARADGAVVILAQPSPNILSRHVIARPESALDVGATEIIGRAVQCRPQRSDILAIQGDTLSPSAEEAFPPFGRVALPRIGNIDRARLHPMRAEAPTSPEQERQ